MKYGGQTGYKYLVNHNLRYALMVVFGLIALAILSAITFGLWTLPSMGLWLIATIVSVAVCIANGAYGLIPGIFVLGVLVPVIAQLLAALTPALPFLVLAAPFVWLWGVSSGELGPSPRPRKKDW